MKNKFFLMTTFCLLLMAVAVSAQDKQTDFSGDWTLNKEKSELGERNRMESMTMKVSQTADEMTVEKTIKMGERPEGENRGGGNRMGGGDGTQTLKYNLKGKETSADKGGGRRGGEAKLKAKAEKDGKLKLIQTRSFETQMGAISIKTVEIWELSADGKTLTVSSNSETPRGNISSKMVFTKD